MANRTWNLIPAALGVLMVGALFSVTFGQDAERGRELYEQGRYDAARPFLEKAVAGGSADAKTLYRLYYTQLSANDNNAAQATLRLALPKLEELVASGSDLEATAYLATAYDNFARHSDRDRIAEAYTSSIAADAPKPDSGRDCFRIARLYEHLEQNDVAEEWYNAAIEKLPENALNEPYIRNARMFIASRQNAQGNREGAAEQYNELLGGGPEAQAQLEKLALDLARQQRYQEASATWSKAVLKNPATGDRARYSARIAYIATELAPLPATAADGRPWSDQSRADLERIMGEYSQTIRTIQTEAHDGTERTREQRGALQARLDEVKPSFFAAALEFTVRGFPLRETAFQAGYATLFFRGSDWEVPRPNPRRGRWKKNQAAKAKAAAEEASENN